MQRILITVSIFTLICFFAAGLLWYRNGEEALAPPKTVNSSEIAPSQQRASRRQTANNETSQKVDPDAFYQTIIDYNLFRPLNWKPPQRKPDYTLLGTAIDTKGRTATAYVQERHSEKMYSVKVGDPLGETTVHKITPKRVTLTTQKGTTTNLSLSRNIFLNPKHTRTRHSYAQLPQTQTRTETAPSQKAIETETPIQISYEEGLERLKDRANELRAERIRMQERLRYLQQR